MSVHTSPEDTDVETSVWLTVFFIAGGITCQLSVIPMHEAGRDSYGYVGIANHFACQEEAGAVCPLRTIYCVPFQLQPVINKQAKMYRTKPQVIDFRRKNGNGLKQIQDHHF